MTRLLALALLLTSLCTVNAQDVANIELKAADGIYAWATKELTLKAGQKAKITIVNNNMKAVPGIHNFVLIKPGTLNKVIALTENPALMSDPNYAKKNYIPDSEDIIYHTTAVQMFQTGAFDFTAPTEPGDYPYLCTFPGHARLMNGVLKVTK